MTPTVSVSIEELYRDYHDKIYRRCFMMVHSHEAAEDLMQDTFLRAMRTGPRQETHLNAWIYRIATNACIDYLRHKHLVIAAVVFEEALDVPEPTDSYEEVVQRELIDLAFAQLRPDHQEVLQRWLEDKKSVNHLPKDKQLAYHARIEFREAYREVEQEVGV